MTEDLFNGGIMIRLAGILAMKVCPIKYLRVPETDKGGNPAFIYTPFARGCLTKIQGMYLITYDKGFL